MAIDLHPASLWEAIADALPDAEAVAQGELRRTWSEFDERAARLASAFVGAGLAPGAKVAMFLFNAPEYLEVTFGALKVRAVPINVNYRYVEDELWYLLDNAEAEALVFHSSLGPRVAAVLGRLPGLRLVIEVDDGGEHVDGAQRYEDVVAGNDPAPRIERDPTDLSMTYTGGTTGMPKGVMGRVGDALGGLLQSAPPLLGERPVDTPEEAVALAVRRHDEGRQFATIPAPPLMHATAMGVGVAPTFAFGGRIVLLSGRHFDATELWDTAERARISALIVVGDAFARPMLKELDEHPGRDLTSITVTASSGAMFSTEVKAGLHRHLPGMAIVDLIAATEGSMGMSVSFAGHEAATARFHPSPGVIVVTDEGRRIEPGSGEVGMVALPSGGGGGYYKDATKTAATYKEIEGARYTLPGDFATVDADGSLVLMGRGSQCINTAGEKVFPEEVEEAVKTHTGIDDCLVFGVPDERFGQRVVAVVSSAGGPVAADEIIEHLRTRLASYKHPRDIVPVGVVPRTSVGKPDYAAARELFDQMPK
jgi:fatty-acyl-CoA synthase